MKRKTLFLKLLLVFLVSIFSWTGCSHQSNNPAPEVPVTKYSAEVNFLATQMNCSLDQFMETEDSYILDGDINFPKLDFWKNYGPVQDSGLQIRAHRRHQYLPKAQIVKINYRPTLPQVWKDAVAASVNNWNSMPIASKGNLIFLLTKEDKVVFLGTSWRGSR